MKRTATLMRFAYCTHCGFRERLEDDAEAAPRMCNGCGHFGSYKFIGVTEAHIAQVLREQFPTPARSELLRRTHD